MPRLRRDTELTTTRRLVDGVVMVTSMMVSGFVLMLVIPSTRGDWPFFLGMIGCFVVFSAMHAWFASRRAKV